MLGHQLTLTNHKVGECKKYLTMIIENKNLAVINHWPAATICSADTILIKL